MKRDLSKMTCIEDLRRVAQRKVPRMFYDYADSGSWTESTYRANSSDFQDIKFRQRVLVDQLLLEVLDVLRCRESVRGRAAWQDAQGHQELSSTISAMRRGCAQTVRKNDR